MGVVVRGIRQKVIEGGWPYVLGVVVVSLLLSLVAGLLLVFLSPLKALAAVMGLLGLLLLLQSVEVGLLLLIAVATLLPFGAIPVNIGFYPTFLDVALLGLVGVWLARLLTRNQERFITSPLDLPLIAFIVLAFVSFVAGLGHAPLTRDILRHFLEVILAMSVYLVVVNSVTERAILKRIVLALMGAGFLACLMGVTLYFLPQELTVRLLSALRVFHYPVGLDVLRFVEDNPGLALRATSTSIDPNVLGGLLILVSSLTALQLVAERPLLSRIVAVPMLAIMLMCLVLTFSRGAFFGFAMGLAFLGVVRYRRLLWLLLAVGLVLLILPQTQEYVLHFQQGLLAQDKATAMRLGEYKDALRLISQYPWFGVGFGAAPTIDLYIGVSNVYLLIAENMGLVGLGTFLIIICGFFAYAWSVRRKMVKDTEGYSMLLGFLTALVGALVGGLLDHYFFNLDFPHSVCLFWVFVGLAVATIKIYCPEER